MPVNYRKMPNSEAKFAAFGKDIGPVTLHVRQADFGSCQTSKSSRYFVRRGGLGK
jgi:hypothetical protein